MRHSLKSISLMRSSTCLVSWLYRATRSTIRRAMFCRGGMSNNNSPNRPRSWGFCWLMYVSRFTWIRLRSSFTRAGSERDLLSRRTRVPSVITNRRWTWTNRYRRRRSLWDTHILSRRVESLSVAGQFHQVFDQQHALNRHPRYFVGSHSDCPRVNNHHSLVNGMQRPERDFHPYGHVKEQSRAQQTACQTRPIDNWSLYFVVIG